jgi:hypothetical protein
MTAPGWARECDRGYPDSMLGKVEFHCVACHRNSFLRRATDRDSAALGGVCWDCGAFYPHVNECLFHDDAVAGAESVEERESFVGLSCEGYYRRWDDPDDAERRCGEVWTAESIAALPLPWVEACVDCPIPWVVTRTEPDTEPVFLTGRGHWSTIADDARRFHKAERAYAEAAKQGGVSHRFDRFV